MFFSLFVYFVIGSILYWAVFNSNDGITVDQNSISEKISEASVFFLWPLWIGFMLLLALFSPLIKIFFNIDIFEKSTWIKK